MFRIARRVAKDRIISTVDPQARHGHKTSARGFDGYKGHVRVDPDTRADHRDHGDGGQRRRRRRRAGDCSPPICRPDRVRTPPTRRRPARPMRPSRPRGNPRPPRQPKPTSSSGGPPRPRSRWPSTATRLRRRRAAGHARTGRRRDHVQGAAARPRRDGRFSQGRLPDRPGRRHGDLPGRAERAAAPGGDGQIARFGPPARGLPARRAVHDRADADARSASAPTRHQLTRARARQADPGLAGRLQGHPPQGRTQDRPPDAPPPRRPPRPRPRPDQESPPTSRCSAPPSTSPASPCSASPPTPPPGPRSA